MGECNTIFIIWGDSMLVGTRKLRIENTFLLIFNVTYYNSIIGTFATYTNYKIHNNYFLPY